MTYPLLKVDGSIRKVLSIKLASKTPIAILSSKDLDDVPINQLVAELEFVRTVDPKFNVWCLPNRFT